VSCGAPGLTSCIHADSYFIERDERLLNSISDAVRLLAYINFDILRHGVPHAIQRKRGNCDRIAALGAHYLCQDLRNLQFSLLGGS